MKHAKTVWKFALVAISYSVGGTGSGRMPRVACRTRRLFLNSFLSMMAAGLWSGPAAAEANAALEWSAIATEAFLPTQGTDPLSQSRAYAMLHAGIKRFVNPHGYPAGLERSLYERRQELILGARGVAA